EFLLHWTRLEADSKKAGGFVVAKRMLDGAAPVGVAEFRNHGDAANAETDTGGECGAYSDIRPDVVTEGVGMGSAVGTDDCFTDVVMEGYRSKRPSGTDEGLPSGAAWTKV